MMTVLIVLLVAALAFANGANDNGKGVATLVGFGVARPGRALVWAAVTTAVGAAVSFWLAGGLIKAFSTGLFTTAAGLDGRFFAAVLIGAVAWVVLATWTGMPVSTTHAITGGLLGAGIVTLSTGQVRWGEVAGRFAMPLALGPVLGLAIVYVAAWPVAALARRYAGRCVCVVEETGASCGAPAAAATAARSLAVVSDTVGACEAVEPVVAVKGTAVADGVHWASSGLVGFARGWNDAPKIAALCVGTLLAAGIENGMALAFGVVAVAMAAGGLLAGRRVLETMAMKLTPLPPAESLTASLATAGLVCGASWLGWPVSTTHVSTGAIIGAGLKHDPAGVKWWKVRDVVLSWVVTLPVAAAVAAGVRWVW